MLLVSLQGHITAHHPPGSHDQVEHEAVRGHQENERKGHVGTLHSPQSLMGTNIWEDGSQFKDQKREADRKLKEEKKEEAAAFSKQSSPSKRQHWVFDINDTKPLSESQRITAHQQTSIEPLEKPKPEPDKHRKEKAGSNWMAATAGGFFHPHKQSFTPDTTREAENTHQESRKDAATGRWSPPRYWMQHPLQNKLFPNEPPIELKPPGSKTPDSQPPAAGPLGRGGHVSAQGAGATGPEAGEIQPANGRKTRTQYLTSMFKRPGGHAANDAGGESKGTNGASIPNQHAHDDSTNAATRAYEDPSPLQRTERMNWKFWNKNSGRDGSPDDFW